LCVRLGVLCYFILARLGSLKFTLEVLTLPCAIYVTCRLTLHSVQQTMANAVKAALAELFADVLKTKSDLHRLLKPSPNGAGSRIFPAKTTKNDGRYGVRVDKGEPVKGKQNTIRLKLQINSNATNKTLRDLAKRDSVRTGPDIESMEMYSNILKLRSKVEAPAVDKYRLLRN